MAIQTQLHEDPSPHAPEDLGALSHSALLALSYQMDGRSLLLPPACE